MLQILILRIQSCKCICYSQRLFWIRLKQFALYFCSLHFLHKFLFGLSQKQQSVAFALVSSSPAHSVNISLNIFRAVKLNDPVNLWEIHTSRSDVCAEQVCILLLHKVEVNSSPFVLLLTSMQLHKMGLCIQFLKGLIDKSDLFARLEEDDAFCVQMAFNEWKQGVHLLLNGHDHVIVVQL